MADEAANGRTEDKASRLRREESGVRVAGYLPAELEQELRMHCAQDRRSVSDALTEAVRALLEQHSESVEALRRQRKRDALRRLLEELGEDDITEEDIAAIRAEQRGEALELALREGEESGETIGHEEAWAHLEAESPLQDASRSGTQAAPHVRADGQATRSTTVHLPVELHQELRLAAARQGVHMSAVIAKALRAWLSQHK
jgi:Arc/MetJ-type ribon-helix-helix transcriptional regulator